MTARSTATHQHADIVSPFEQIKTLEDQQEARVDEALKSNSAEEQDTSAELSKKEKEEEGSLRRSSAEEVDSFARTESAAVAKKVESETDEAVTQVTKQFKSGAEKTADMLVEQVLKGSFITK